MRFLLIFLPILKFYGMQADLEIFSFESVQEILIVYRNCAGMVGIKMYQK